MLGLAALGTLVAVAGIAVGWSLYRERRAVDPLETALGPAWNVLLNRYYIDDFYMTAIVRPVRDRLSAGVDWTNQHVLDGVVNGAAGLAKGLARAIHWVDRSVIDGAVNGVANITGESGGLLQVPAVRQRAVVRRRACSRA